MSNVNTLTKGIKEIWSNNGTDKLRNYVRVGTKYFKVGLSEDGEKDIKKWDKETIKDDFSTPDRSKPYLQVKKYEDFTLKPDNLNYEQEVNGYYNLYSELTHKPVAGNCDTILSFLKHLTQDTKTTYNDAYDILLDYITVLYKKPTHILPILAFISPERQTGKTTFLDLMREVFQKNAVMLNNETFQKSFNAHFALKILLLIDEMFQDKEKKQGMERVKEMVTAKKAHLEYKGVDAKEIPNYKKLIMCLNDSDNLWIQEEETRYFVLLVKPIKGKRNPMLLEKMVKEIPSFLDFIMHREMKYPVAKSRAWFPDEALDSDFLREIKAQSRPQWQKVVDDYLVDAFASFEGNELMYSTQDLVNDITKRHNYGITKSHNFKESLKKYLKSKGLKTNYELQAEKYSITKDKEDKPKQGYYGFHSLAEFETYTAEAQDDYSPKRVKGSYYTFSRQDWDGIGIVQENEVKNSTPLKCPF
jgi:hypothetical protein